MDGWGVEQVTDSIGKLDCYSSAAYPGKAGHTEKIVSGMKNNTAQFGITIVNLCAHSGLSKLILHCLVCE